MEGSPLTSPERPAFHRPRPESASVERAADFAGAWTNATCRRRELVARSGIEPCRSGHRRTKFPNSPRMLSNSHRQGEITAAAAGCVGGWFAGVPHDTIHTRESIMKDSGFIDN